MNVLPHSPPRALKLLARDLGPWVNSPMELSAGIRLGASNLAVVIFFFNVTTCVVSCNIKISLGDLHDNDNLNRTKHHQIVRKQSLDISYLPIRLINSLQKPVLTWAWHCVIKHMGKGLWLKEEQREGRYSF